MKGTLLRAGIYKPVGRDSLTYLFGGLFVRIRYAHELSHLGFLLAIERHDGHTAGYAALHTAQNK